jgi:hypothetical protein
MGEGRRGPELLGGILRGAVTSSWRLCRLKAIHPHLHRQHRLLQRRQSIPGCNVAPQNSPEAKCESGTWKGGQPAAFLAQAPLAEEARSSSSALTRMATKPVRPGAPACEICASSTMPMARLGRVVEAAGFAV